jgi:hypothetical protein
MGLIGEEANEETYFLGGGQPHIFCGGNFCSTAATPAILANHSIARPQGW